MIGKKSALVLSFASLLVISSQTFALQIYKGRLVNHKEWSTGKLKADFKDSFSKKNFIQQKFLRGDEHSYANVNAFAANTEGKINNTVSINGGHNVYASNNTQSTQKVQYILALCAETSQHTSFCSFYHDDIELEAGGYIVADKEPVLQVSYDKAGMYRSGASVYLMVEADGKIFSTGSNAESKVFIS